MGAAASWVRKVKLLLSRNRFHSDLQEEMAFHRDQRQQELEAAGMCRQDAYRKARVEFGNDLKLRDESHAIIGFRFETLAQDIRYAVRQMLRAPGFTLAVVLTLALGVGANTAIFSVVQATLLRPLPYPDADRIARISDARLQGRSTGGLVSVPRFFDLQAGANSFDALASFYFEHPTLIVNGQLPEPLNSVGITGPFWQILGVQPILGRTFEENANQPNAGNVIVLSYTAWQKFFGGDRNVLGRAVSIDKQTATVIGVMPASFDYPNAVDAWRPSHFKPSDWKAYRGEYVRFINVIGKLKAGASLEGAQNEMRVIGEQIAHEHPDSDGEWRFESELLRDHLYGTLRPELLVLLAASAVLLLIACLNIANLLLSRATSRQREIALRQALGASRARVVGQLMTESILLAVVGGAIGLASAVSLVHFSAASLPSALRASVRQSNGGIGLDWPVVLFALAVSLAAGVFFGLAPLIETRRTDLNTSLKVGESRISPASGSRLRSGFISLQVGLSLILLVSACLLVQSLWKLTQSPLGFQPDHILTFETNLVVLKDNTAPVNRFYSEVQSRLEGLPGVTSVGQISALPTVDWHVRVNYDTDWAPRTSHKDAVSAECRTIAGDYLEAMRIPLLAGRKFRTDDGPVILVNQEFVRQFLPAGNPVGRHLLGDANLEIVGVIGNVRGTAGSIADAVQPEVYFAANGVGKRSFVVRSTLPPEQLIAVVRSQIHQVDPTQAVGDVRTLDDMIAVDTAQPRLNMSLLVGFAAIALSLACVGIYGVVAYSVAQRRQEIGVRMALGATRQQISILVLRRTVYPAIIGLIAGTGAALLLTRLLSSQLYGIKPNNPMTFLIAILLLLLPVLAASLRPALQAALIDPVDALRAE